MVGLDDDVFVRNGVGEGVGRQITAMQYVNLALAISSLDHSFTIGWKLFYLLGWNTKHLVARSRYIDGKGHIEVVLVSSDREYTEYSDAARAAKGRKAKRKEQSKEQRAKQAAEAYSI